MIRRREDQTLALFAFVVFSFVSFARAALFDSIFCGVFEVSHNFHETRLHFSVAVNFLEARGGFHCAFSSFRATFATALFVFNITGRFRTL